MKLNLTFRATSAWVAGLVLLAGCAGPSNHRPREREIERPTLPALSADSLFAESDDPWRELDQLRALPNSPSVRLRRAFLRLETGGQERTITDMSRLVFGDPEPTREVKAFALYLRALAYQRKGDAERSRHDLAEARPLALEAGLRRRIEAVLDPVEPAPQRAPTRLAILPRSAWNAAPSRSNMTRMTRIHRVTVHHSAVLARSGSRSHTAAVIRSFQRQQMEEQGWGDIGYHYLIDREGRIWTGRPTSWQGAHAGDGRKNRGNVGICLLGNFVRAGGQSPSGPQLDSLERLVGALRTQHRIPVSQLVTHQEIHPTDCPGGRLQAAVERMRRNLARGDSGAERLDTGHPAAPERP